MPGCKGLKEDTTREQAAANAIVNFLRDCKFFDRSKKAKAVEKNYIYIYEYIHIYVYIYI